MIHLVTTCSSSCYDPSGYYLLFTMLWSIWLLLALHHIMIHLVTTCSSPCYDPSGCYLLFTMVWSIWLLLALHHVMIHLVASFSSPCYDPSGYYLLFTMLWPIWLLLALHHVMIHLVTTCSSPCYDPSGCYLLFTMLWSIWLQLTIPCLVFSYEAPSSCPMHMRAIMLCLKPSAILHWPVVKKEWKQDCTYVDHNQWDLYHLKSYSQYCGFVVAQAFRTVILKPAQYWCIFLNGKGSAWLWPTWVVLFPDFFNKSMQYGSWLLCLCIYVSSGGEVHDYIKCEPIGGGSPRHLNTFSNLFIVAMHCTHTHIATHAMYCCSTLHT